MDGSPSCVFEARAVPDGSPPGWSSFSHDPECPADRLPGPGKTVERGRVDLTPLLTHRFSLDRIVDAYRLLGERRDSVLKVAIRP
jgi:hypothetical protein